jgi:hypothetical protein
MILVEASRAASESHFSFSDTHSNAKARQIMGIAAALRNLVMMLSLAG